MTPGAGHGSVHAAQRITGLIVVELGNGPDRFPPISGMAVLAGKSQIAVRAVCAFGGLPSRASREYGKHNSQDDSESCGNPSAHDLHLAFVLVA